MICPFCREGETKVIDSRERRFRHPPPKAMSPSRLRTPIHNLRKNRGFAAQSYQERWHARAFRPAKNPGRFGKRLPKTPRRAEQIEAIVAAVEVDVYEHFEMEVPTRYIGERIYEALREVDEVAFVRFASVYRDFQDVNDFVGFEPLLRTTPHIK